MSDIQDKDDELSDIVLLPYDFPLLNPPPFVIDFLKSVDERLLDSRFNFPLDALRDLYKKDKYLFSKIKFFLSLYGCNFHSKKPTSFFPNDVNKQEDVIRYYGTKEDTFSVAEIALLGIWDFCGYAGGCKCSYFDGVVIKRLKELGSANFEKMLSYPNFASSIELLYVKSSSSAEDSRDDDKDEKSGLPSDNGLQPEAFAPELSKEEYLVDENTAEEESNEGPNESAKDSLADCAQEEDQPLEAIAQGNEQTAISIEDGLNKSFLESDEPENECSTEFDIKIPFEKNCCESDDDLTQANEPDIDEQKENNFRPVCERAEEDVPFIPKGERKGVCAPAFWLRFVCSFFTMVEEAKNVYHSLGYNNFEDLVELKDEDIEKIVKGIQQTGIDSYLQGVYEEELVSYCLSRKCFLKKHCVENFFDYLSFEKYTPNVFIDEDILFIDYTDRPYLIKDFDEDEDFMPEVSNLYLSYLKRFGVHSLLFIGEDILQDSIDCYSLRQSDRNLCSILNPYRVVNSLCYELMGKSEDDVFALDKELSNFWINDCSDFYKFNYGKYENERLKKRLEILSLRESGEYTLEELGQKYDVTRERIRQIEAKALKIVGQNADSYLDLLFFRRNFVPAIFLKDIPGLIGFIKSDASSYYYCEELGIVVRKCYKNSLLKEKQLIVRDGYTVLLEDISSFYKKHGFSVFPWLNKESYHVSYSPFPNFIFKKIPMMLLGSQYLLSKGTDGFDLNINQEEAVSFFMENAPYTEDCNYHAIFNDIIRSGAVLRGMSTYISPKLITEEQKQVVIDVLNRTSLGTYGATGLSIFADNKDLLLQYGIDNGYYFYGIASFFFKDKYDFSGRGLRISSLDEAMTLDEMAEHYIVMNGPVVKVKDFLDGLHLKEPALQQIKTISKYDSNTLVRKGWFKWTKAEFENLESFIDEKIKEKGFCHGWEILNSPIYFDESKNHFLQENRIGTSTSRLIYFMDGIAERFGITKYHFSHRTDCVSLASNPVETKVDMARTNFKGRIFDKSILENFYQLFKLTGSLVGSDFFEGWAVPVSLDSYALKEDVEVSDGVLEQASDILDKHYSDELYITATSALNRLDSEDFPQKFDNRSIELASLLSSCGKSNWTNPEKDELITSNFYLNVLVNKKMIGKSSIKYSEFIREFIRSQYAGRFLSFGQITDELKKYEVLNKRLPDDVLSRIFADWCDGVIVEVPE